MKVPWLAKDEIAWKAFRLLTDYEAMVGRKIGPPIPVEDIIERYLGLNLCFEDLDGLLDGKNVLGALYVKSMRVCVNEKLLEGRNEGRLVFTCAHEAGHWVLHRHLVDTAGRPGDDTGAIVCRAKNARKPIEWQADYFAACLLMPEDEVKRAFYASCGPEALVLTNVRSCFGGTAQCIDPCAENWHLIADLVCEAGRFTNVSRQAMIIRMEELGLLVNLTSERVGWGELSKR